MFENDVAERVGFEPLALAVEIERQNSGDLLTVPPPVPLKEGPASRT